MSDPLPLALLGRRMAYANTYYHCEPRLEAAGFVDVRVRRAASLAHGVWSPGADGWPITARRPIT